MTIIHQQGEGFNHRAPREDLDFALITARPVTALCGVTFVPRSVSTGSDGRASDPRLPSCPECAAVIDLRHRITELQDRIRDIVWRNSVVFDTAAPAPMLSADFTVGQLAEQALERGISVCDLWDELNDPTWDGVKNARDALAQDGR